MAAKSESKKQRLSIWIVEHQTSLITEAAWAELKDNLAPVSESYLRKLVRETGLPMVPLVEGVAQDSLEALERTLMALEREYTGGGADRAKLCRAAVITAKDHLKWTIKRLDVTDPKLEAKQEMLLWMMTWLDNPGLFGEWIQLRKRSAGFAHAAH